MEERNDMERNAELQEQLLESNKQILKELKKQNSMGSIRLLVSIATLVCTAIVAFYVLQISPKLSNIMEQTEELVTEMNIIAKDTEQVMPELQDAVEDLNDITDSLTEGGLDKLYDSVDKLNQIDIETLNNSIQALYDVVQPLAGLFGGRR